MGLKFWNPKFNNFFWKITFIYKMQTLWKLEVNKAILQQVKVAIGLWLYAFQFFKKQKPCKQN